MLLLVCMVGCDQTSKHMARAGLGQTGSIALSGGLVELRLAENPGSFLSLGAMLPDPTRFALFTLGIGSGLVVLATYLTCRAQMNALRFTGLSLVLCGGLSNLLDRILRHGLVTDFVTIHFGPFHTGVFNLADVLIMIGAGVIFCALWRRAAVGT